MFENHSDNQRKVAAFLGFGRAVENPERIQVKMMDRCGNYLPTRKSKNEKGPGETFEQQWNQWEGQIRLHDMGCPDDIKPEQWEEMAGHMTRIGRVKYVEPAAIKDLEDDVAAIMADLKRE